MPKPKIKVSDIQNLTDARYFAAMDVEYLGFCCNPRSETFCSVAKIKEITEWVEGPHFVLQFQGYQHEDEIKNVIETGIGQALHFGVFATYEPRFGLPIFKEWIFENVTQSDLVIYDFPIIRSDQSWEELNNDNREKLRKIACHKFCYLDLKWDTSSLSELLDFMPHCGLILRGDAEERVGFKTYNDLDEIFEILESI